MWEAISAGMGSWYQGKLFLERALPVSNDSLHVIFGALVLLALALLLRRPVTSWAPWLGLLAFALWNEAVDLWVEQWPDPAMQYGEGAWDLGLTMLLPTLLLAAARLPPGIFRRSSCRRAGKQR